MVVLRTIGVTCRKHEERASAAWDGRQQQQDSYVQGANSEVHMVAYIATVDSSGSYSHPGNGVTCQSRRRYCGSLAVHKGSSE